MDRSPQKGKKEKARVVFFLLFSFGTYYDILTFCLLPGTRLPSSRF